MPTGFNPEVLKKAQDIILFSFQGDIIENPSTYFQFSSFGFEVDQIYTIRNSDYNLSHYFWGLCRGNVENWMEKIKKRGKK